MACATLKRSLDWESLNQRPTKRRRCGIYPTTSNSSQNSNSGNLKAISEPVTSVFADASLTKLTPEKMAQNIRDEITRLHRRKQLNISAYNCERMQDSESSGSEMGPDSPRRSETPPNLVRNPEKGLFTFKQASESFIQHRFSLKVSFRNNKSFYVFEYLKQVQLICESMLKEREESLREQYDAVLTTKLAEQYDAFVKFTYDQIQRRYEAAPSCKSQDLLEQFHPFLIDFFFITQISPNGTSSTLKTNKSTNHKTEFVVSMCAN